MTGPEHFREAELLLGSGCEYMCPHSGCEHEAAQLARAQVHATLALAAATATVSEEDSLCPEGCGCRLDGEDADRRECGCPGPCTGDGDGDEDWGEEYDVPYLPPGDPEDGGAS
jgi:hypothetical protein